MKTPLVAKRSRLLPAAQAGYTILEICLVLFIIALIAGLAIPFTGSLVTEQKLRDPSMQIEMMARSARHLATLQHRPYVLILNRDHIKLQPYDAANPLLSAVPPVAEGPGADAPPILVRTNLTTTTTTFSSGTSTNTNVSPFDDNAAGAAFTMLDPVEQEYSLPSDVALTIKGWQEKEWTTPQDRTWIFPPTGLCEPLTVHLQRGDAFIEDTYDPLTGSVKEQKYSFP